MWSATMAWESVRNPLGETLYEDLWVNKLVFFKPFLSALFFKPFLSALLMRIGLE